jgi:hypothetical protein
MNSVRALLIMLAVLLSGCASVPMGSADLDAKAKEFAASKDTGALYIYRNETFGAAIPLTVSLNGKTLGQTASKTYYWFKLLPGKYTVQSLAEDTSTIDVNVEAGRSHFVWQEVKMGMWAARSLVQEVDEATGRAGVSESKLIATQVTNEELAETLVSKSAQLGQSDPNAGKKLRELQTLRNDGVISKEEFEVKKNQLLKAM